MPEALNVLTYTSLFPNARQPRNGIFIERRLRHLIEHFPVTARVVAPVPWFPLRGACFGQYGVFAAVPSWEAMDGLQVWHRG